MCFQTFTPFINRASFSPINTYKYIRYYKNRKIRCPFKIDDVNLIGDDIRTIERIVDVLLNACKGIGLAVNIGKTKYMKIGLFIDKSKFCSGGNKI